MSNPVQFISGRHWQTGDWISIEFNKKHIVSIKPQEPETRHEQWLAPGLLDLQMNGYGGIDFQQPKITSKDLITACKALNRNGCSRFFLTLITSPWTNMMGQLKHIKALRDFDPYLCDTIVGWHIEGPFLSEEPGYCGAHDVPSMEDPTPEKIRELRTITGADPTLLTMAPERNASIPVIAEAKKLGIHVSLGHTNANVATLLQAAKAGASGFTHLGNACPQKLDRHDNLIFRALDSGDWMTGIIPDGIHVSPTLFRLFHKLIPNDHIYYTTDAMSAAGAVPGRYKIGKIELEVGTDQVVRQPGQSNFAGSALKPCTGIMRAADMLNLTWRDVWHHFSEIPARWMQVPTGLAPGSPSHFCILQESEDYSLNIQINQPSC